DLPGGEQAWPISVKDHTTRRFAAFLIAALALLSCIPATAAEGRHAIISNIEPRRDIYGEIVDAHDGCLEYFDGRFYLYGVRFGKGNGFGNSNRYVCYSSLD